MVLRSVFHGKLLDDIADDGGEGEGVWVIEFVVSFGSGRGVGGTRGRCAGRERRIDGRVRAKISIHSLAFCAPSGVTADTGVVVVVPVIVVTGVVIPRLAFHAVIELPVLVFSVLVVPVVVPLVVVPFAVVVPFPAVRRPLRPVWGLFSPVGCFQDT